MLPPPTSIDDCLRRDQKTIIGYKRNSIAAAATNWTSLRLNSYWRYDGSPGGGAHPSVAFNPDRTTIGALGQENAPAGKRQWIIGAEFGSVDRIGLVFYDRLAQRGGYNANISTLQAAAISAVRYTGTEAAGNEILLELGVGTGTATETTATVLYTSENGPGRVATCLIGGATGNGGAGRLIQVPRQAGDRRVLSVESVQLAAGTGSANNFAILIVRRLFSLASSSQRAGTIRTFALGKYPEIKNDACIFVGAMVSSAAVASDLDFRIRTVLK